jgi:pimeloyl-ACP methyl ester carboxylesterase
MTQRQPMRDILVLVPGILGSVLVKDGREVWGTSGRSIAHNLLTFGRALIELKLQPGIAQEDPHDGVSATRLLPRLFLIPTFWKADGYGKLRERLSLRFALTPATTDQPGNLIEFPYDWRLSNQLNGKLLGDTVFPYLERWRRHTNNPDAKLVFICHSMGGLVARWFLEVLGGRDVTRMLITIGTPYRGSINALKVLMNGMSFELGPIGLSLDELVRSFPSVYQLLPTYRCLDLGDGRLQGLAGIDMPNLRNVDVQEGLAFHARIGAAVEKNARYTTIVIKGIEQPTDQSAQMLDSRQVATWRSYDGIDHGGDGTVPRPSSHPPEWADEGSSVFASQTHAMLQSTESILTQVFGALTGYLGRFLGGARIALDVPDLVPLGRPVPVEAISKDSDATLPLHVVCQGEDGRVFGEPSLMRAAGDGRYHAKLDGLPEGAWRITVQSATTARPVEPVSDWLLVWNAGTS